MDVKQHMSKPYTNQLFYLLVAATLLIISWFIPYGRLIFYPLTLLGTWFHEMGHALATVLVGGKMGGIQIFSNLSGVNYSYLPQGTGNAKIALVSAVGPIMPSIFGALLIMSGRNKHLAKFALIILSGMIVASSVAFMGMYSDGMALVGVLGIGIGYVALKLDEEFLRLIVHILGIEAILSILAAFDYLKTTSAVVGGRESLSDTQQLAELTGIHHLFWAFSLTTFSIVVMVVALLFSFGLILKRQNNT
jgi:hypothetical protein